MTSSLRIAPAVLALALGVLAGAPSNAAAQAPMQGGPAPVEAGPCAFGSGVLPGDARAAVDSALADERRAEAQYTALVDRLGAAPNPFSRIVRAERRHAAELEALLAAHRAPVPAPATFPVPNVATPREACAFGAASERQNIALYDRLLAASALPPDVRCVFERLRDASRLRHLPAFESCAASR